MEKIDSKAVSLAGGLTWALALFVGGILSMWIPGWQSMVNWIGQFYVGYGSGFVGSLVGAVWGFFDLFIGLYVFCWLYNYFHEGS
ncbi:MAG: hypothetical protein SVV03_01780 [Candidatus Nanohaloarchaea archaeon]|nr:hypothetical protein [Candidatus Nanohaloarchaea archaeon]